MNGEQEHNTAGGKHHCRGPSAKSRPPERVHGRAGGTALRNPALSPRSSLDNELQGQRADGRLVALAVSLNSSAGLGGLGQGQGAGVTPREETTARREEGAGSLRRFQPEGAGGLATAPRTS